MKPVGGLVAGLAAAVIFAGPVAAGSWAVGRGDGQIIIKFEDMRADDGFDPSGARLPLPEERRDTSLGVFAEYGLTDRLTLQFKGDWQSGEDAFVDYDGRGPIEVGVWWQAYRDDRWAVSAYAGYADGGEGRNAGYAGPGQGDHDVELRLGVGRNIGGLRWLPDKSFVEVQAARRFRSGLPDETRVDATFGGEVAKDWLVLAQAYGGVSDETPRWLNLETSVVRRLGPWALQAGWRETVAGRETPVSRGPVVAVWRRF